MAKAPLISVLMAVYNGEKYLRGSIQSILDQTCPDFEFIIVNDGSIDRTDDILAEFSKADKRIRIINQDNQGLAQSLNNGIQVARGKFIARMDDDDIALPDRLKIQSQVMLKDKRIGLCHSLFGLIDENGKAMPFRNRAGFHFSGIQTRWTLIWRNCICHPSVMIRSSVLNKYNMIYNSAVICQDYDLWCRLIAVTEFYTVQKPLLLLRKHSGSVSSKYNQKYLSTFSHVISRNLKKYMEFLPNEKILRRITLLSGQMHIRGKGLTCRITAKEVLSVIESVTTTFIELHALNHSDRISIKHAAGQQLFRWAQQAWFHNKSEAAKLFITGLHYYLGIRPVAGKKNEIR